jgi:AAA domain
MHQLPTGATRKYRIASNVKAIRELLDAGDDGAHSTSYALERHVEPLLPSEISGLPNLQQLQHAGIAVAQLHDIKRQRNPALKVVVEWLSEGEVRDAVRRLDAQGRVHVVAEPDACLRAVATAYATNPADTLVVSPDNQLRGQLNTGVRAALLETGQVGREDRRIAVLVPRQA